MDRSDEEKRIQKLKESRNLLPFEGEVYVFKHFIADDPAQHIFQALQGTVHWQQGTIKMYGKMMQESRLSAWYGDQGAVYTYSGKVNIPYPWTTPLLQLKEQLNAEHFGDFNSCLLNYYRDGKDGMGFHADNEKEIDQSAGIASLSFGGARDFIFKHRSSGETIKILLGNGDLVMMAGETQKHWVHGVPKRAKAAPRINLTFRRIIPKTH